MPVFAENLRNPPPWGGFRRWRYLSSGFGSLARRAKHTRAEMPDAATLKTHPFRVGFQGWCGILLAPFWWFRWFGQTYKGCTGNPHEGKSSKTHP